MRIFHLFRIRIILLFVVLYDFSIFFREPTLSRSCLVSGGWYHIRLHFESCLRICGSINGAGCNQFWPGLGWKVLLLGPHVPGRWAALPPVTQLPSVTSRDNSQCDNRLCVCRAQTIGIMIFDPLSFVSSSSSVQSQLSQKPLNAIFQLHIKSLINTTF